MLGRFLELSVQAPDIRASIEFYESLGFRQCVVGEAWSHPYAVLSDGRLFLGLHQYAFDSPALCFVLPELAAHLPELERRGVRLAFRKTSDTVFNEAGFADPDGHMIALLEARTFSPPGFERRDFSLLGRFEEYSLPVRDQDAALGFWESLGARRVGSAADPDIARTVEIGGASLGLHPHLRLRQPALTFAPPDLTALLERLRERGHEPSGTVLRAPEGLQILLRDTPARASARP